MREFSCRSAEAQPTSLGPVVIPGRQAQGNEDYSADDTQKDHDLTWFMGALVRAAIPTLVFFLLLSI
jgi:hypothetical protein